MWVLQHIDELFAVGQLMLETSYLNNYSSSYSESFYGLKRATSFDKKAPALTPLQKLTSLFFLVAAPYLKSKLDDRYQELQGKVGPLFGSNDTESLASTTVTTTERLFVRIYPVLNAIWAAWSFIYQVWYLYRNHKYFNPALHLQGLVVQRVSGEELMSRQQQTRVERSSRNQRLMSFGALGSGLAFFASLRDKLADYAYFLLPLTIFSMRAVEWWYSDNVNKPVQLPIPPPPEAFAPAADGIKISSDPDTCSLCSQKRTNPAAIPTGYVFCYPCIFAQVRDYGRCPVTHVKLGTDSIRRLFDDT